MTALLTATPAAADNRQADAHVDGNSIDVVFTRHEDGTAVGQPRHGTSACTWSAVEVDPTPLGPAFAGRQPSPEHHFYMLYCDGDYRGTAWLGPTDFTAPATQPLTDELVRRIEVLPATVDVRPERRGVTGIPSLFWVNGYDGAPINETLSAFGLNVAVNATMTDVTWDFGDGTAVVHAGLGEAWPQRSSVQHNYANPSTGAGYKVTCRVTLTPSFTVNGGGATPLAPIVLTFTRDYLVDEVQAVRNR